MCPILSLEHGLGQWPGEWWTALRIAHEQPPSCLQWEMRTPFLQRLFGGEGKAEINAKWMKLLRRCTQTPPLLNSPWDQRQWLLCAFLHTLLRSFIFPSFLHQFGHVTNFLFEIPSVFCPRPASASGWKSDSLKNTPAFCWIAWYRIGAQGSAVRRFHWVNVKVKMPWSSTQVLLATGKHPRCWILLSEEWLLDLQERGRAS